MLRLVGLACLLLASAQTIAETAKGTVFHDVNRNGILDSGEPGLADVRVSNGLDVVLTDASGQYAIDLYPGDILFITKPAQFATPVDSNMLPQFYYIHDPEGSPKTMRYVGIEPTGPLPETINFPLVAREEASKFRAILLSDTQPQTERELDFIRDDVLSELVGTEAAFGMTMGDIMYDDMSLFPRYIALIGELGMPWYNVPGNHEINFEATNDEDSLETFKRYFGPPNYAFEYADAVFIVLDNIYYKGNGEADPGDVRGSGGYENRFTDDQLKWLGNELAHVDKDKLVFVAVHAPLGDETGAYATLNRRKFFKLLEGRPNLYAVAGHTHTTYHTYFGEKDGFKGPGQFHHHVLAVVSGSWWSGPLDERGVPVSDQRDGTPNGYHFLEVDGTDLSLQYKAAGKDKDYQMRIMFEATHHGIRKDAIGPYQPGQLLDGRLTTDDVPATGVLVNLFDGGPRSKVEFSVDGKTFLPMKRVIRKDPYILEQFARHRNEVKSFIEAQVSTHLFEADLPDDLSPGTYTVTVRAEDEFGQVHHGHRLLEVFGGMGLLESDKRMYP